MTTMDDDNNILLLLLLLLMMMMIIIMIRIMMMMMIIILIMMMMMMMMMMIMVDLGLCSHPSAFLRSGVRTHFNSKGKIPPTEKNLFRGGSNPRRRIKQDSELNTLPAELFWPLSWKQFRVLFETAQYCVLLHS